MQPADDDPLAESIQSLPMAASAMRLPRQQQRQSGTENTNNPTSSSARPLQQPPPAQSEVSLPFRPGTGPDRRRSATPSSAAASLFRSTLTPPGSRSASPAPSIASTATMPTTPGTARFSSPARTLTGSVFGGSTVGGGSGGINVKHSLLDIGAADNPGDPLSLILRSFVPHIAIHGSRDVDDLVREKGFNGGLWELLRPFGERVQGKVTIRDSNGGARSWEDFSVRFVRFGDGLEDPDASQLAAVPEPGAGRSPAVTINGQPTTAGRKREALLQQVEKVVDRHLSYAEEACMGGGNTSPTTPTRQGADAEATSPYYSLYLRRLLSGIPLAPHESFAHPVASVMAISSRNPAPIDALRQLYTETTQGESRLPGFVDGEYLRYYILVHDEERSDIAKSMALFDQMKRHFGLHCHLLRIRSSQSAETDDDSIPLPRSDWMTASEELADIERSEGLGESEDDFEDPHDRYIFESDATAIRTFVREMVTQSIIPTMERNTSVWNDQVASRRRGISGRFMSLSKRWAFGSSSKSSAGGSGSGSSNNYDPVRGFYRPDTAEAIMRRLADFAFMLRDWKLAMSTYELIRSDFANDKAWRYHAAANEMAALSLLIMPQSMSSKTRIETINQMIEQALYSYQTRCSSLYGSVRCTVLALELLRLRGGSGVDEAVRWGTRVLESRLLGPIGNALLHERVAVCYASKRGVGSQAWGSRRRKAALWSVLAAERWIGLGKFIQAQRCLNEARKMYSLLPSECGVQNFAGASDFLAYLNDQLKEGLRVDTSSPAGGRGGGGDGQGDEKSDNGQNQEEPDLLIDVESETLGQRRHGRKASLSILPGGAGAGLETAPLTPLTPARLSHVDDDDGRDKRPGRDGFG